MSTNVGYPRFRVWVVAILLAAYFAVVPQIAATTFSPFFDGHPGRRLVFAIVFVLVSAPIVSKAMRYLRHGQPM